MQSIQPGPPELEVSLAPTPRWVQWLGKVVDVSVICIGGALAVLIFANVVLHAFGKDLA